MCKCDILLHLGKVTEVDQLHLDDRRHQNNLCESVLLRVRKSRQLDKSHSQGHAASTAVKTNTHSRLPSTRE